MKRRLLQALRHLRVEALVKAALHSQVCLPLKRV